MYSVFVVHLFFYMLHFHIIQVLPFVEVNLNFYWPHNSMLNETVGQGQ